MNTLLLDGATWDLLQDAAGNIAMASNPYSLAQDAASAIKTFEGEVYWDTNLGVPYMSQVLGLNPSASLLKSLFNDAAQTVPEVASAQTFLTAASERSVGGQVQVKQQATGAVSAVPFTVINPQGGP
jgi:hypothetical protein